MRNKQKGGVILLSKESIKGNKSCETAIRFFLQNSRIDLFTQGGAEGVILRLKLNPDIESPFVKLKNNFKDEEYTNPFEYEVPVEQLILKINFLNSVRSEINTDKILIKTKRTITMEEFFIQIEHEKYAFLKTFNGVESMVPTIIYYDKIIKYDGWETKFYNLFANVHDENNKELITYLKESIDIVDQGIGICFYEMIDDAITVYDYLEKYPMKKDEIFVKIFAKMILIMKKGMIHGDHHRSNVLVKKKEHIEIDDIQIVDFARSIEVKLPEKIEVALNKIETTEIKDAIKQIETAEIIDDKITDVLNAIILCLNFIYDSGYYHNSQTSKFDFSWKQYIFLRETIKWDSSKYLNINRPDLAIELYELVRAENAKQDKIAQFFSSILAFVECNAITHVRCIIKNATEKELIESILVAKDLKIEDLGNEQMQNLQTMTRDQLEEFYKDILNEEENIEYRQSIVDNYMSTDIIFSLEFIDACRRKMFESEATPKYGGSAASSSAAGGGRGGGYGHGGRGGGYGGRGGAKTKRIKRRKSRKGKKRNNYKTKHRKLVGGGRFDNTVFAMPGKESNYPFEKTPTTYKLNSPIKMASIELNTPIETQDNWISHYYNMDFAKTQETINKCFIQHDFFAGIIIILIKLGVIGNNPPSIILKTEKAKTIINNAIEYYKKLDKILYPLNISSANGASPVAFQPRP